jgi:hypothetical protein
MPSFFLLAKPFSSEYVHPITNGLIVELGSGFKRDNQILEKEKSR